MAGITVRNSITRLRHNLGDYYATEPSAAYDIMRIEPAASELGTGTTRLETLRRLGIEGRVLPAARVEDGINAVRLLLPRCWFDLRKCAAGLEALRQYQREWDDKAQDFRARPLHDWTSHAADAFRYLSAGLDATIGARGGFKPLPRQKNIRVV